MPYADSKLNAMAIPTLTEDTIKELIHDMVYPPGMGAIGILTTKLVAGQISRSERHASRYIDGEYDYSALMYINLAKEAFRLGDQRLIDLIIPEGFVLMPSHLALVNHNLDDEIAEETLYNGKMREAFNRGDYASARKWKLKHDEISNRLDQEIEAAMKEKKGAKR
jgi:hypothetical protein